MTFLKRPTPVYRTVCRMSKMPRILVEGPTDKHALGLLHKEKWGERWPAIAVDTIDKIYDPAMVGSGSRERVEEMCRQLEALGDTHRHVLGLVDREYRPTGDHQLVARHAMPLPNLVWTPGHSIENYLLDERVIIETLRTVLWCDSFDSAKRWLSNSLIEWCRQVAIIGLSFSDLDVETSAGFKNIDEDMVHFDYRNRLVILDLASWRNLVAKRIKLDPSRQAILDVGLAKYSFGLANVAPQQVLDQVHGHAVARLVKVLYLVSLGAVGASQADLRRVRRLPDESLIDALMATWAVMVKEQSIEHPSPLEGCWVRSTGCL